MAHFDRSKFDYYHFNDSDSDSGPFFGPFSLQELWRRHKDKKKKTRAESDPRSSKDSPDCCKSLKNNTIERGGKVESTPPSIKMEKKEGTSQLDILDMVFLDETNLYMDVPCFSKSGCLSMPNLSLSDSKFSDSPSVAKHTVMNRFRDNFKTFREMIAIDGKKNLLAKKTVSLCTLADLPKISERKHSPETPVENIPLAKLPWNRCCLNAANEEPMHCTTSRVSSINTEKDGVLLAEGNSFTVKMNEDLCDSNHLLQFSSFVTVQTSKEDLQEKSNSLPPEDEIYITAETSEIEQQNSEDTAEEEPLSEDENSTADTTSPKSASFNDTIDEMDMILSMGIDYLEKGIPNLKMPENTKQITPKTLHLQPPSTSSNHNVDAKFDAHSYAQEEKEQDFNPIEMATHTLPSAYSNTNELSLSKHFTESSGALSTGKTNNPIQHISEYSIPPLKNTPVELNILKSAKSTKGTPLPAHKSKKFVHTPVQTKTPTTAKTHLTLKSPSFGTAPKSSGPTFSAPINSASFALKNFEQKSCDFKQPKSMIPKLRNLKMSHITSPIAQYIKAPSMAPIVTNIQPQSPLTLKDTSTTLKTSEKENSGKINTNSCNLPFVDYDSGSSIKVVEHIDKQKALPKSIKKLMPSGGTVLKHTGRVNLPESVDGRQEVSILYSHDAVL